MYVSSECKCGANFNVDSEWEESAWLIMFRFVDAHVKCGTFTKNADLPARIDVHIVDEREDGEEGAEEDGDEDEAVA